LLRIIILTGIIEIGIGLLQLLIGGSINPILFPRATEIEIEGYSRGFILLSRGRELSSIFGTLGDTIFFALFMLIVLAVYLGQVKKIRPIHLIFCALVLLSINYAYARSAIIGSLIILIIYYRMHQGRSKTTLLLFSSAIVVLLGLAIFITPSSFQREYVNPLKEQQNVFQNLSGIFTKEYFERAQSQRLGALTAIPPIVISDSPLIGYGPDEETTIDRINSNLPKFEHHLLARDEFTKKGFEDVYWVALLAHYGLFGLGIFLLLMIEVYVSSLRIYKSTHVQVNRSLAVTTACIVGVTFFLLFFERVLEYRAFSFYFWLLPGLMYSSHAPERASLDDA
jgi:hypothetical protein